jgi:hypothetical protein
MSLSLALMSLSSSSQSVTRTNLQENSDSLICLPKKILTLMVRDINKFDAEKIKTKILTDSINIQKISLIKQDDLLTEYKRKNNVLVSTVDELKLIDESNQRTIEAITTKNKRYKKQRNIFKISLGLSLMYIAISSW